jgi:hypothetical protein
LQQILPVSFETADFFGGVPEVVPLLEFPPFRP